MTKQTIITGNSSLATDEAVDWLKEHGATVQDHNGLSIITLPDTMELDRDHDYHRAWRYTVALKADEHCGDYVEICTDADPYKIEMHLERQ